MKAFVVWELTHGFWKRIESDESNNVVLGANRNEVLARFKGRDGEARNGAIKVRLESNA